MKKLIVPLALATVFLVGCESNDEPREAVTETVTETPDIETEGPSDDDEFVEVVRDELGLSGREVSDRIIVGAADEVCSAFDTGATVEEVASMLLDSGFQPYEAGFFTGASVSFYCPEYTEDLDEFVDSYGGAPA